MDGTLPPRAAVYPMKSPFLPSAVSSLFPSFACLAPLVALGAALADPPRAQAVEGAGGIRIEKVDAPETAATLRWLGGAGAEAASLGEIAGPGGAGFAVVRGGWSAEALTLELDVADPAHVSAPDATRLWAADSVEVRVDLAPEESAVRDEWKLIFGLLADGPAARQLEGPGKIAPEALAKGLKVERQEGRARTRYRIELPWELFSAQAGARPTMRLGVQVNDLAPGRSEKTSHVWNGGSAERSARRSVARTVAFGEPQGEFAALDWADTEAWSADEPNVLSASVRSARPVTLRVGDSSTELRGGEGWSFWRISAPTQRDGERLVARLADAPPAEAVQTKALELRERIAARVAELTKPEGLHPLFRRHLESIEMLVADDWERVTKTREDEPAKARESLGYYRDLLAGLAAEAGEWDAFLAGRRSLVMAYRSEHDATVQYYMLGLPRDWDEARRYPLFFELHGAGSTHPLNGPASRLGAKLKAQNLAGYDTPK